jgi:hypothetical protein
MMLPFLLFLCGTYASALVLPVTNGGNSTVSIISPEPTSKDPGSSSRDTPVVVANKTAFGVDKAKATVAPQTPLQDQQTIAQYSKDGLCFGYFVGEGSSDAKAQQPCIAYCHSLYDANNSYTGALPAMSHSRTRLCFSKH